MLSPTEQFSQSMAHPSQSELDPVPHMPSSTNENTEQQAYEMKGEAMWTDLQGYRMNRASQSQLKQTRLSPSSSQQCIPHPDFFCSLTFKFSVPLFFCTSYKEYKDGNLKLHFDNLCILTRDSHPLRHIVLTNP